MLLIIGCVQCVQTSIDQLLMHYSTAILNTAFTKVLGYVELCAGSGTGNFQKRQYQELCQVSKSKET